MVTIHRSKFGRFRTDDRTPVASFPLTFFVTDSGESIGRKLINARTTFNPHQQHEVPAGPEFRRGCLYFHFAN